MHDQALVWNTDTNLQVTSLTARLRDFAKVGVSAGRLHVSDLWGQSDPFAVAVVAHHWALDGESLSFEAPADGATYRFDIQPLQDVRGTIVGVSGRAIEIGALAIDVQALNHVERSAGLGTWYEDLRTGLTTVSEGLAAMLGTKRHHTQLDIRRYDHPEDRTAIARDIARSADGSYSCDHRILCPGGRVRNVRERMRTIYNDRGTPIARIGTMVDISDLKEREAELSDLALRDALTQLPNRAALQERLSAALEGCPADRRCAVLFIDLDDFKSVNDAHGHAFGDQVLACVAERLSRHVRSTDTVARLGGDEFVVLLDDLFTDDAAVDAARKILRSFDQPFVIEDRAVRVSASIGIATAAGGSATPCQLLGGADREMYAVKRNGGSGVKLAPAGKESAEHTTEKGSCQVHSSPGLHPYATLESA